MFDIQTDVITFDLYYGGNLPLGAYLMEVTSDNTGIAPQRKLFYVSNLAVMIQQLPDDKHRYVVVNATVWLPCNRLRSWRGIRLCLKN